MDIEPKLTASEINVLLGLLGELTTKTGIWPVAMKIQEKAEAQILPQEQQP